MGLLSQRGDRWSAGRSRRSAVGIEDRSRDRWRRWTRSASAWTRVDGRRRVVLEVRQGRVVRVGRQPGVDELLDDAAPPERAADEAATALGLEVGQRSSGPWRSARGRARPRPRRRPRRSRRPLPRRSSTGRAAPWTRFSALGRNSAWRSASVLLDDLEVRLLGDPLAGQRRRGTRRASPRPPGRRGCRAARASRWPRRTR